MLSRGRMVTHEGIERKSVGFGRSDFFAGFADDVFFAGEDEEEVEEDVESFHS